MVFEAVERLGRIQKLDIQGEGFITYIAAVPVAQLSYWLEVFVLEVRKRDGSEYSPGTLHHLVAGLMCHLREAGIRIDIFSDDDFANFRRIRRNGAGKQKGQAEVITEDEEELLWSKGILGDHTPQALLNTVFYMCGVYFALRSGQEHRQLCHKPCQITVVEKPGEGPYLLYIEDMSKNNQFGLKGRKFLPKSVKQFSNESNPDRCFTRLFKLYNSLCPVDRPDDAFYLKPLTVK